MSRKCKTNPCQGDFRGDTVRWTSGLYNLRLKSKFVVPRVCTVHNGQNYIQYYGPLIWNMIPGHIKYSETLDIFKDKIRKSKPINCPCRHCKKYIPNLGVINQI